MNLGMKRIRFPSTEEGVSQIPEENDSSTRTQPVRSFRAFQWVRRNDHALQNGYGDTAARWARAAWKFGLNRRACSKSARARSRSPNASSA